MKTGTDIRGYLRMAAAAALAALAAGGCFKKVDTDTTAVVKTLVQEVSGGGNTPSEGVEAYVYYTGTEEWEIRTWDDAVQRIVTSTADGSQRTGPDVTGSPYDRYEGCYTALPLTSSPAMIVVVEPQKRMYAYMFKTLTAENLDETFLTLIFHVWRDKPYTEGSKAGSIWNVFPPAWNGAESEGGGSEEEGGGETGDGDGDSGDSETGGGDGENSGESSED